MTISLRNIFFITLLIITNWFFHNVYWTGWLASFHRQKTRLIGGTAGQFLGLAVLGFTSIYRTLPIDKFYKKTYYRRILLSDISDI